MNKRKKEEEQDKCQQEKFNFEKKVEAKFESKMCAVIEKKKEIELKKQNLAPNMMADKEEQIKERIHK